MKKSTQILSSPGQILEILCGNSGKCGMYCSVSLPDGFEEGIAPRDLLEAAPWLETVETEQGPGHHVLWFSGEFYIFFDSEEEMYKCFNATVGDDGPTKSNPYEGQIRIYALTCGADGSLQTENT